jgi:hypothetical protein
MFNNYIKHILDMSDVEKQLMSENDRLREKQLMSENDRLREEIEFNKRSYDTAISRLVKHCEKLEHQISEFKRIIFRLLGLYLFFSTK